MYAWPSVCVVLLCLCVCPIETTETEPPIRYCVFTKLICSPLLVVCALQVHGGGIKYNRLKRPFVCFFVFNMAARIRNTCTTTSTQWHANVWVRMLNVNVNDRRSHSEHYRQRRHENIELATHAKRNDGHSRKRNNELYSIAYTDVRRTYGRPVKRLSSGEGGWLSLYRRCSANLLNKRRIKLFGCFSYETMEKLDEIS